MLKYILLALLTINIYGANGVVVQPQALTLNDPVEFSDNTAIADEGAGNWTDIANVTPTRTGKYQCTVNFRFSNDDGDSTDTFTTMSFSTTNSTSSGDLVDVDCNLRYQLQNIGAGAETNSGLVSCLLDLTANQTIYAKGISNDGVLQYANRKMFCYQIGE